MVNRNAGQMGHFNSSSNNIVQELDGAVGGMWSSPVYFNGKIYFWGSGDVLKHSRLLMECSEYPHRSSQQYIRFPRRDANYFGQRDIQRDTMGAGFGSIQRQRPGRSGDFVCFRPNQFSGRSYLQLKPEQQPGQSRGSNQICAPDLTNGKVYVGAEGQLCVYGLLP